MSSTIHFSGHETFPFRYGWLKKGVDAVRNDPDVFVAEDATTRLGVGKNMVRSIRHWCLAVGLLDETVRPGQRTRELSVSGLGERLVGTDGLDPYLEDPSTLWLLHYQLAGRPGRAQTWYWAFNHWKRPEFSRDELSRELGGYARSHNQTRASDATIRRDVDCFIRTYVSHTNSKNAVLVEDSLECPLSELNLLVEGGDKDTFSFQTRDDHNLTEQTFAYLLAEFWQATQPNLATLSIEQIAYAPGSPGKVLKLPYHSILERLERLDGVTTGLFVFRETAGLRQVLRTRPVDLERLLSQVYSRPVLEMHQ